MKAEEARAIYVDSHLTNALQDFYEAIRSCAFSSLSGNFYNIAINHDYAILRLVKKELEENGYHVAYADGEIRSTKIFSISWSE